jgi:hypothetical protein
MKYSAMKKHLLLSFFIMLSLGLYSQNTYTDSSVTCVAYWKKNDIRTFTIAKYEEKKLDQTRSEVNLVTYDVTIRVLDSTKDGYTLEWKQGNVNIKGMDSAGNALAGKLLSGVKFIYSTEEVGAFKELLNWQEVRDFYVNMLKMQFSKDRPDSISRSIIENMISSLSSKESVEAIMIKEVQLLYNPFGVEFPKRAMSAETELPNMLGGQPFPAILTFSMGSLDVKNNLATVLLTQEVDKQKGKSILLNLIQQMSRGASMNEINSMIDKVEITDKISLTFHLATGWQSRITYVRIVDLGKGYQKTQYIIEEKKVK